MNIEPITLPPALAEFIAEHCDLAASPWVPLIYIRPEGAETKPAPVYEVAEIRGVCGKPLGEVLVDDVYDRVTYPVNSLEVQGFAAELEKLSPAPKNRAARRAEARKPKGRSHAGRRSSSRKGRRKRR